MVETKSQTGSAAAAQEVDVESLRSVEHFSVNESNRSVAPMEMPDPELLAKYKAV